MRFVGRYFDELTEDELRSVTVKRVDDRLGVASRELVIRERQIGDVVEITVSRVLDAPID